MLEFRNATRPVTIEKRDKGSVLVGYGAVFYRPGNPGTEYELAPGVMERIGRNAFNRTLSEGTDVRCTFNHNNDQLLGRTISGTCRVSTDNVGLRYEVDIPNSPIGQHVVELVNRGDVRGGSFTFYTRDIDYGEDGSNYIRTVLDLELLEVGPVVDPAYTATTAAMRALMTPEEQQEAEAIAVRLRLLQMDRDMDNQVEADRVRVRARMLQLESEAC